MNNLAQEVAKLVEEMPADKAQMVVDFARFLVERNDAAEWQHQFSDPRAAAGLTSAAQQALQEFRQGLTAPLAPAKL